MSTQTSFLKQKKKPLQGLIKIHAQKKYTHGVGAGGGEREDIVTEVAILLTKIIKTPCILKYSGILN